MARAKLRKMLGSLDDPEIVALMRLIETQSRETLASWSLDYAVSQYWPILVSCGCADARLDIAVAAGRDYQAGTIALKELKKACAGARKAAQECAGGPAAQAAARAVATACAVPQTPTNALGFVFYGAAASAYASAGLDESPARYDALAKEELGRVLDSLRAASVPDELDPVRISWNC